MVSTHFSQFSQKFFPPALPHVHAFTRLYVGFFLCVFPCCLIACLFGPCPGFTGCIVTLRHFYPGELQAARCNAAPLLPAARYVAQCKRRGSRPGSLRWLRWWLQCTRKALFYRVFGLVAHQKRLHWSRHCSASAMPGHPATGGQGGLVYTGGCNFRRDSAAPAALYNMSRHSGMHPRPD